MGKRGPKPTGGYGERTVVLSTRITSATRAALAKSAAKQQRTISAETEYRLRRSFDEDEKVVQLFGGPQMYAILRLIGATMNMAGQFALDWRPTTKKLHEPWLQDPYAYNQAVQATMSVLEALRPPGDPSLDLVRFRVSKDADLKVIPETLHLRVGERAAVSMISEVASAPSTIPAPNERIPSDQALARRIAEGLGPLRDHLKNRDLS